MKDWSRTVENLVLFLQTEVAKAGFKRVIFGLSGGIDSAVVAVLCQKAFGTACKAILMPSDTTNPVNMDDALALAEKFGIETQTVSIAPMLLSYPLSLSPLRKGNMAARLRMMTLYDLSVEEKALVVGTSNKSEILLGYGTLFGDTACAINPIGSLFKTEIFALARFLGVTEAILTKAPSADLWEGQTDEEELGYTYAALDKVLRIFVEEGASEEDLVRQGFDEGLVRFALGRYYANLFKQSLPVVAKL